MRNASSGLTTFQTQKCNANRFLRFALVLIFLSIDGFLFSCADRSVGELRLTDLRQARVSALRRYPNLRLLDLRETAATEELVLDLSAGLPDCDILWLVPIGNDLFDNSVSSLTLPAGTTAADISKLVYFDSLKQVDATSCTVTEPLLDAAASFPEVSFVWNVAGVSVYDDTVTLDFSGKTIDDPAQLILILESHPRIVTVELTRAVIRNEALVSLYARHGGAELIRTVSIAGREESCWIESLNLSGISAAEASSYLDALAQFPLLKAVDLTGQPFSFSDMDALITAYPDIEFYFSFQVFSEDVSTNTESLDLSGIPLKNTAEIISILRYLPRLKEVNLCDCGLTDAQMDELIAAFPETKFIWYIRIGGWKIRTDITAFSKGQRRKFPDGMGEFLDDGKTNFSSEDLEPLKYCSDLIFLDLGHGSWITDLSILYHFPKLRGLILSMNKITDITPISSLKELESLEIYQNYITDVSPLSGLTKLKYLNMSVNSIDDVTPLTGMKQLRKLWLVRNDIPAEARDALVDALPECEICFWSWGSGTGGWRDNELYFEYQKAFNLPTKP